ncbi:uncharacterized protein LOC128039922 [Gossypium raimondii]|uniref:uncharacterized protein LOC128039922 n=1 Tax=Gossypium raimondii TaxID=29730 RepID=UPI00227A1AE0|nr:uncharacterized protein LOC128039922 [Gossypium raimondii]
MDHHIRDNPLKADTVSKQFVCGAQSTQQDTRFRIVENSRSIKGTLKKNYIKPTSRVSVRANMIKANEDADLPEVITGKISFLGHEIHALIGPGSTHSYICTKVMEGRSLEVVPSKINVLVTVIGRVMRDCLLIFGKHIFLIDLLLLSLHDFEDILGLDWLTRHSTIVDSQARGVCLLTTEGKEVFLPIVYTSLADNIISVVSSRKFIVKGTDTYLAYIMGSTEVSKDISKVSTMNDFSDMFPEELLGMPPDREVEFSIEVALGTAPISCTPY